MCIDSIVLNVELDHDEHLLEIKDANGGKLFSGNLKDVSKQSPQLFELVAEAFERDSLQYRNRVNHTLTGRPEEG